jgi:hypothetical protein
MSETPKTQDPEEAAREATQTRQIRRVFTIVGFGFFCAWIAAAFVPPLQRASLLLLAAFAWAAVGAELLAEGNRGFKGRITLIGGAIVGALATIGAVAVFVLSRG